MAIKIEAVLDLNGKVKDWRQAIIFQAVVEDKARVDGTIIGAITYI